MGTFFRYVHPRETKEYGIPADFQTPTLQFAGAFVIRCLLLLMAVSWLMIVPPLIPWVLGMVVAVLGPIALVAFFLYPRFVVPTLLRDWTIAVEGLEESIFEFKRDHVSALRRARQSGLELDEDIARGAGNTLAETEGRLLHWGQALEEREHMVALVGIILAGILLVAAAIFAYFRVWDWWEVIVYSFCGIPTPHAEGLTVWLPYGLGLGFLGTIFTLWRPSKYTFGLQVLGLTITLISWFVRPVTVSWSRGAVETLTRGEAIFYAVYACICISWWLAARSYLRRMHAEMEDDYGFEWNDDEEGGGERVQHSFVRGPYSALSPPPRNAQRLANTSGPTILTHNGKKRIVLDMRDFVEVIGHMAIHGLGERDVIKPKWITSGGTLVSQHPHWRSYIHPLEEAGIYDRKARQLNPEFEPFDALQVLKELGLAEYAYMLEER